MIADWNAGGDFAEVLDTLETVSILPSGCREHAYEAKAWRFGELQADSAKANGGLRRIETTWQIATSADDAPLRSGDLLVESSGVCAELRSVRLQQGATRSIGVAVRHEIQADRAELFDVERPVWVDGQSGPEIDRYALVRPALVGLLELDPAEPEAVATEAATGTFYSTAPAPIELRDRLVRHRGGEYEVTEITAPSGAGEPWVYRVAEL